MLEAARHSTSYIAAILHHILQLTSLAYWLCSPGASALYALKLIRKARYELTSLCLIIIGNGIWFETAQVQLHFLSKHWLFHWCKEWCSLSNIITSASDKLMLQCSIPHSVDRSVVGHLIIQFEISGYKIDSHITYLFIHWMYVSTQSIYGW